VSLPAIPERQPIHDAVTGVVASLDADSPRALLIGIDPPPDARVQMHGDLIIRYGIPYLGKPHVIVPGLIAIDYGMMITGDEAWDFLLNRSNLYPRADVFGFRSDGVDDMITVKMLDLAQPVRVLVYETVRATHAAASVIAVIASAQTQLPTRLSRYLPRFETWHDWQHA
jgi:hypothetical protein